MKKLMTILVTGLALVVGTANAAGCLKGAAVGGVAGHVAGKHGVVGAVGGCVVGRHMANKKAKKEKAAEQARAEQAKRDQAAAQAASAR
jgi:outer membrane lipoprotein SlyB